MSFDLYVAILVNCNAIHLQNISSQCEQWNSHGLPAHTKPILTFWFARDKTKIFAIINPKMCPYQMQ